MKLNLLQFLIKIFYFKLINILVSETLKIGNKVTDFFTRKEYNKEIVKAGMIDINVEKVEIVRENVRDFAQKMSVLEFNSII